MPGPVGNSTSSPRRCCSRRKGARRDRRACPPPRLRRAFQKIPAGRAKLQGTRPRRRHDQSRQRPQLAAWTRTENPHPNPGQACRPHSKGFRNAAWTGSRDASSDQSTAQLPRLRGHAQGHREESSPAAQTPHAGPPNAPPPPLSLEGLGPQVMQPRRPGRRPEQSAPGAAGRGRPPCWRGRQTKARARAPPAARPAGGAVQEPPAARTMRLGADAGGYRPHLTPAPRAPEPRAASPAGRQAPSAAYGPTVPRYARAPA